MTRSQRIWIGAVVLATLAMVAMCVRRGADPRKAGKGRSERAQETEGASRADEVEPDDPNDPDEPEAFDDRAGARNAPTPGGGSAQATPPAPGTPTATFAPAAGPGTRVERLHSAVLREAVRANWVTVDDSETPCPPDRIRIVYSPPANIGQYKKGAYFEPLGPAPGEATDEVNGLLVCEGHVFLYRGFEAYFRADSGRWDIFPFPVIEE